MMMLLVSYYLKDAIDSYNSAIKIKPDDYMSWNNKAASFSSLKLYKDATDSADDRIFLSLPQEMRPLLREALGLEQ